MNTKSFVVIAAGLIAVAGLGATPASATVALVDFETTPGLPTGPSIYIAVPAAQTIITAPATFTGGVVLGFATFFPAIAYATAPNVYGTANFGNGLPETLTIAINPTFATTEVSFALFNGETFNQTYTVNAFNGASIVATQTLINVSPNFNSGFGLVDLNYAPGITSVTIVPTGAPAAWDFLIDTVAFNQSITTVIPVTLPPAVPPPIVPPPQPLPVVFEPLPPTEPVVVPVQVPDPRGHGQHRGQGLEGELVEINFGDNITDIKGSVLVVPEPGTSAMVLVGLGLLGFGGRRRDRHGEDSSEIETEP